MKNFLVALLFIAALPFACSKKDSACKTVDPKAEEPAMLSYASANGITPVKHSSGMYYQIITPGTGATPAMGSIVSVTYTGKLINNTVFDMQEDASKTKWPLNTLIEGWQIGIPLIKKGGKIKLLVPSKYGYGCNGAGPIPGNSILIFDIELVDVQ